MFGTVSGFDNFSDYSAVAIFLSNRRIVHLLPICYPSYLAESYPIWGIFPIPVTQATRIPPTKTVIYIAKLSFSLYYKAASERLPTGRARSEALVAERGGITTAVKISNSGKHSRDEHGGRG